MDAVMTGSRATAAVLRGVGPVSARPTSSTASFHLEQLPEADSLFRATPLGPATPPPMEHSSTSHRAPCLD